MHAVLIVPPGDRILDVDVDPGEDGTYPESLQYSLPTDFHGSARIRLGEQEFVLVRCAPVVWTLRIGPGLPPHPMEHMLVYTCDVPKTLAAAVVPPRFRPRARGHVLAMTTAGSDAPPLQVRTAYPMTAGGDGLLRWWLSWAAGGPEVTRTAALMGGLEVVLTTETGAAARARVVHVDTENMRGLEVVLLDEPAALAS